MGGDVPSSLCSLAAKHFSHENSPSSVMVRTRESTTPDGAIVMMMSAGVWLLLVHGGRTTVDSQKGERKNSDGFTGVPTPRLVQS